ncbi:MAG: rhomboid family intramembrane serine protease [Rhodobacteraceae bacterium]|nr:rhomboid family intramembrane serine protease [Paracoccaceae bacterium]
MYDPDANEPPLNPLPPVVVVLALVMGVAEIVFQLGEAGMIGGPRAIGWRGSIADTFAFSNNVFDWMWTNGRYPPEHLMRFVTYLFVHISFAHALFAVVLLLALGKYVGEQVSALSMLVIFFGSAILAALAFALFWGTGHALIGGYPAVYGLIGAYSWILIGRYRDAGDNFLKAFRLIAALLVLQLIYGLIFGGKDWVADVAGFFAGLGICVVMRPENRRGLTHILERTRNR